MKNNEMLVEEEREKLMQNVLRRLRILFRIIQSHSRVVEKKYGMSSAKLWMLWEIFNNPGLKVSELADALIIHASTCSNLLDKLQQDDLIRRDRNVNDQRTVRVYLTDKGNRLLEHGPPPARGRLSEGLLRLSERNLLELDESLGNLVAAIQSIEDGVGMMPMGEK